MPSHDHPYRHMPDRSFWSRSVSTGWNPHDLMTARVPVLLASDRIMSAGSCFAANTVPFLEAAGYIYVRTESIEETSSDRFGYGRYSAAYGNIYTPRQLLQLVRRSGGSFKPVEDRWHTDDAVIDPFRPGLPFPAETDEEFDVLTAAHLARTREAVATADVFIATLGLTEAWVSSIDGAVFPACPGTIAGNFDPQRHMFKNFGVSEIVQDLRDLVDELRRIRSGLRVVLTVSPVPLVATATAAHVVCATSYSKSVLRVACEEIERTQPDVVYFPAYEIITGPQAPDYFEPDRRNVSDAGIKAVMDVLLANSARPTAVRIASSSPGPNKTDAGAALSHTLAQSECEEMMADPHLAHDVRGSETPKM
jgi:hypothetical protein